MHITAKIGRTLATATLAAAIISGTATRASAETPSFAPGWQGLIGCWEPVATARDAAPDNTRGHRVCIVPVAGSTTAVDMVTIAEGGIVERERVDATGARQPLTRDDCSGWQTAEWSAAGHRLYLRSELTCDGGLKRASTGVISMPKSNEWVDVQSVAVGERKAVRALRYRESRNYATLPASISEALGTRPFSVGANTARMAASAPVTQADLIDVSRRLDASAIEVWLVEQDLGFTADAKALVGLANAGVAGSVIDVVVALSYPEKFSLATQTLPVERPRAGSVLNDGFIGGGGMAGYDPYWNPYYGSRYNYDRRYYSPYGFSQYGSSYGYGSGWYPSQRPVIIVVATPSTPSEPQPQANGRMVKGQGYTRRPTSAPATDQGSSGSTSDGSSSTGSSGSGSTGSSGSSGSSGERTAKRRPPPSE